MAAGATITSKIVDVAVARCVAVAAIGAARTTQGKKRFAEGDDRHADVRALTAETQGYAHVSLVSRSYAGMLSSGSVEINVSLLIYLPKDTTTDANSALDLAENTLKSLMEDIPYNAVGGLNPTGSYQQVFDGLDDGVLEFTFSISVGTGPLCTS